MQKTRLRRRLVMLFTVGTAAMYLWMASGHGPARASTQGQQPAAQQWMGVTSCVGCHSNGPVGNLKDDYVLLTESKTWEAKDKHSQAFNVLKTTPGSRAEAMAKILKQSPGWEKPFTEDARCLNCHAANVPTDGRFATFKIEDGVSCDACHGPAFGWFAAHIAPGWRTKPMAEKVSMGMTDVRDPVNRSAMCFSCHIGEAKAFMKSGVGKVVTHEMYAAGHPPLPSIEVATFSEHEPRHWRYLKEKNSEIQKLLKATPSEIEFEQTKLAVVGNVVALRDTVNLLADQASKGEKDYNSWPELSQYDCYACHHDLRTPSWRQKRGYPGIPGRPQIAYWPSALAAVGIRHIAKDNAGADALAKSFHDQMQTLHKAFNDQPFGKPQDVGIAAGKLATWLDKEVVAKLNAAAFTDESAKALLREICKQGIETLPDYNSARQIIWTLQTAYSELPKKPANDAAIKKLLGTIDTELKLNLPWGKDQPPGQKGIIAELKESLEKISNYDAERFQQRLKELLQLLS